MKSYLYNQSIHTYKPIIKHNKSDLPILLFLLIFGLTILIKII